MSNPHFVKTAGELIEALRKLDPETPVVVSVCDYGDHSDVDYIDRDALNDTQEVRLWSGKTLRAVRLA